MELSRIVFLCGIVTIASAEWYPSHSYGEEASSPQKIILRSKRQQCVCVSVFFPTMNSLTSSSNFQCSCDPNGKPIGYSQQQQELQKELAQVQRSTTQDSQCGCQLNPAYTSTTESTTQWSAMSFGTTSGSSAGASSLTAADPTLPVYDCSCVNTGTETQSAPGQSQTQPAVATTAPTAAPTQPTLVTTTTPYPSTSFSVVVPRCQCIEIILKFSSERQFQCDCGNGPSIVSGQNGQGSSQGGVSPVDPNVIPGVAQTTAPPAVIQTEPPVQTTAPTVQTTTTPTTTTTTVPSIINTTPAPYVSTGAEPDAVPCVMIQIRTGARVCACQENYKQCTDTACCNVKKYRSLADDPKPSFLGQATATVDLLVDLLQKVRETLV